MTPDEWENLDYLVDCKIRKSINFTGEDHLNYLLEQTRSQSEHTEDYYGPCRCKLCMIYDDEWVEFKEIV